MEETEEIRKARKSARRWGEIHRMVNKFRGASLLAAIPLVASDFWAYASGGFKGTAQFFQGMSTSAQVAVGAFLALIAASVFTYVKSSKATIDVADKSYAYNVKKQAEEYEEGIAEEKRAEATEVRPILAALKKKQPQTARAQQKALKRQDCPQR
jgi:hypothetical protein